MSHSCALHSKPACLTMEKSVQCDNALDVINLADTAKEYQKIQVSQTEDVMSNAPITNGHTPFPATTQTDVSIATDELQSQPLVKAISEEKHAFLQNILGKNVKDDMNLEIIDFYSLKENRLNFSLSPHVPKPASLVTIMKFQRGEFVEVKSPSSYNSSMCLRDMKKAISAALDSCISESNVEAPVVPSPPRSSPRQDVMAYNTAENTSQEKNVSPKRTPPKRVVEGNTGTSENTAGTSEDMKGKSGSPKGNTGSKSAGPKGMPEGTKEKSKKTPEKVKEKTAEVLKEKPQLAKEKAEAPPAKPKPAKPPQVRVKKIKIPDEESIKFANRQREIQRMKKDLKERLKREGKDGVDPAARINAWGRTVGVTCTMCGNHVQKSYGCFRRETAPERLLHLFTPGMNRIKICRRCLPYKKQAGKGEQENRVSKPGLLSLPGDPRGLNPETSSPLTIAPLPDKPVSATTLSAIHRKVTGQESTDRENTAHVNIGAGHMNNTPGHVSNPSGHVNNPAGFVSNGSGHVNAGSVHVNTGSVHVNTESGHVIDTTAPCLPQAIDLSREPSEGSAIEYIKKLALNLRTNYAGQQGESNMAGKPETTTPEEQIIKTPIFEHLSNFTPVTPSMSLGNQVTNTASGNVPGVNVPGVNVPGGNVKPAQWKPVLNQVTHVNQPVTPENTASFVQGTDGNIIPTPPWTTVPIVLKTQPNIVLTSPGQVPRDPKSAPLQTFVTTANQKDLKLLPAIMMPSQNALSRQGPVVLQIQRVKLVRDRPPGGRVESKDKKTENQGKQHEVVEQSEAGLSIMDYAGYTGNVSESTGSRQPLPGEISSTQVENSISNFLSQAKEISPTQVEPANGNFQTFTEEISSTQVETSTVDLQSIAGEMSSSQVETSTDDIQKITEEIASLIENASGYTQDKDANMVDRIGYLGTEQGVEHIEQNQSEKPSEGLRVVDSKTLESGYLQPNEALGDQMLSSGDLGTGYSQHEPAVVLCGSADIASQGAAMYPSGYQVIGEKDDGILGTSTNTCVRNIFESQISEEYLPQVDVEDLNEMEKTEQEALSESIKDDSYGLLPEGSHLEENELPKVHDVRSCSTEVHLSENQESGLGEKESKDITTGKEFPVEMTEDDEMIEGRQDSVQMGKESPQKARESPLKDGSQREDTKGKTDANITTKPSEKHAKMKETRTKTVPEEKSIASTLAIDENITLDLRRSQRRTASPRKPSPSKSPAKKIEPKVHGTRQQRQKKVEQQESQKDKSGQQGTLRDKTGSQGSQKDKTGQQATLRDKTGQQGSQKDKTGQQGTQRGKTERQGSQKDEKEPEATQGVKRKRPGRGTKPSKVPKQ